MASLAQYGGYVPINLSSTTKNGYYVIKFISEAYTLKNNITIDEQIITDGILVGKAQYICSV